MAEVDPGRTSANTPGIAENFERMQAHEVAYQVLTQNPPPLPQAFIPPLSDKEWELAVENATLRMGEQIVQTWDTLYDLRLGHMPERDFAAIFAQHEPLFVEDPMSAGPVPNPWLAQLMVLSSRQAALDLQRYARIRARTELPV